MRKLMWFTIGFALASLLWAYFLPDHRALLALALCGAGLALCLFLVERWKPARFAAVVLLGAMVGFGWCTAYGRISLSDIASMDGKRQEISVTILDVPEKTTYGCRVEGLVEINGSSRRLMLYLYGEDSRVKLGDVVTGDFLLRSCLPGGSRDNSYNRGNGIYLIATSGKEIKVTSLEALPWGCWPAYVRQEVTDLIDALFPADTVAFARALLLGDTSLIDYKMDTDMKLSGIRHIIAVSGLHVTILFSLLYFLTGRRKWLVAFLGLPMLLFFAAVVGFTPSITRACIMHGLMVLAMLFDKEYDGPSALAFAVLVMLAVNPNTILSVSFQLSVGCMVGIFLFSEPIKDWLMEKRRLGKFKKCRWLTNWFSGSVGISIGAAITTTPLCALYFHTVSLVSILTNLLTLWVVTYVFYGIMAACLLALLWQPLGLSMAWYVAWGIRYVLGVSGLLADFPLAAVYTDSVYIVFWLVLCYGLLAIYMTMKRKRPLVLSLCGSIALCVALLLSWAEPLMDGCRVTMLDVGQGQCILLQSEGKNYLVDCGGDSDTFSADGAARLLLSQGISRLDGIILTHYDRDHAGGVENLLTRIPADKLYLPEIADGGALAESLGRYNIAETVSSEQIQVLTFGDARITLIPSKKGNVDNESGLCVLFQRGDCDILITGDRSAAGERELLASLALPKLEVLVAGHHGSKHSTSRELLEAGQPEYVFISVGETNSYGHPAKETLELLTEYGCICCRTDIHGTVIYRG